MRSRTCQEKESRLCRSKIRVQHRLWHFRLPAQSKATLHTPEVDRVGHTNGVELFLDVLEMSPWMCNLATGEVRIDGGWVELLRVKGLTCYSRLYRSPQAAGGRGRGREITPVSCPIRLSGPVELGRSALGPCLSGASPRVSELSLTRVNSVALTKVWNDAWHRCWLSQLNLKLDVRGPESRTEMIRLAKGCTRMSAPGK